MTRETVMAETPARFPTSRKVTANYRLLLATNELLLQYQTTRCKYETFMILTGNVIYSYR